MWLWGVTPFSSFSEDLPFKRSAQKWPHQILILGGSFSRSFLFFFFFHLAPLFMEERFAPSEQRRENPTVSHATTEPKPCEDGDSHRRITRGRFKAFRWVVAPSCGMLIDFMSTSNNNGAPGLHSLFRLFSYKFLAAVHGTMDVTKSLKRIAKPRPSPA